MNRRKLLRSSAVLLATPVAATQLTGCSGRLSHFVTWQQGQQAVLDLLFSQKVVEGNSWNLSQVLQHLAQSIEFSMQGFPALKGAWFRSTVGSAAFAVFNARGAMSHDLSEPIPGAPALDGAQALKVSVQRLLDAGADKVAIRTAWISSPDFVAAASRRFGRQAIVVALDVEEHCWTEAAFEARRIESFGAGELLLTSVEREGTMEGYDLELLRTVANAVDIPVIAHGGCSGYEDMYNAIQAGASAVAAGALFQFTDCTPRGAAEYLSSKGVEVRL